MRFIARDERTERHLEGHDLISQPSEVIRSRHFFHNRGTILQKSFEGLLRSILYQILDASPRLSECLRPVFDDNRLTDSLHAKNLWTSHILRKCLHHVLKQSKYDVNLFILLDALDEYDGTPEYVSNFLKDLLKSTKARTRVKILFSSRPWETFRENFNDVAGLDLQEHNQADIRLFCENICRDQDLNSRSLLRPLVPEIVHRSNGVFIWVKYILEELVAAASSEQNAERIPAILDSLPTDLGDYYASVIRRIDQKDRRDAYALFQLVACATDGQLLDSMDVIFAHPLWSCSTYDEARTLFNSLMKQWVPDTPTTRIAARAFTNPYQNQQRFVQPRYLIKRYGRAGEFAKLRSEILKYSGGLIHLTKHPGVPDPKDLVQIQLDDLVKRDIIPRRTATAMKPMFTKFTEEDQEPYVLEPSHQTVYEFIKNPGFKDLLLQDDAELIHENRHTWFAKVFFAQNLLMDAGKACAFSELTTGRSMAAFIDSVPQKSWKRMYEEGYSDTEKCEENMVDSSIRFAVIYGLRLYLQDILDRDIHAFRDINDELILVVPAGFDIIRVHLANDRWQRVIEGKDVLDRHREITRMIIQGGYCHLKTQAAFRRILWILGSLTITHEVSIRGHRFDSWEIGSAEAKLAMLVEMGQDPNVEIAGMRARHQYSAVRNPQVKWRPVHVASLEFTQALHNAGANLRGEDAHGNTALDWLLAPWDTTQGRKSRGLAHRLVERVDADAARERWGKIGYLLENGVPAKTTPAHVWQCFITRHVEGLQKQSVRIAQGHPSVTEQKSIEAENSSLVRDNTLLSVSTSSSTATVPGFSDVITRVEAGGVVTYTNLGDDGNLLASYFHDMEQAKAYLDGLPEDSLGYNEAKKQRRLFAWRSRS